MIDGVSLADHGEVFRRDGVVRLKGALSAADMELVEAGFTHLSHARLAGAQNPGLDSAIVRAVYRFGGG